MCLLVREETHTKLLTHTKRHTHARFMWQGGGLQDLLRGKYTALNAEVLANFSQALVPAIDAMRVCVW